MGPDRESRTLPALAEALRYVQMSGVFYCPSELTEPFGIELPPMPDTVWFHAVTEGSLTLEVEGERHDLRSGDLVLIPHGAGHRAWGAEETHTPSVFDLPHDYYSDQYATLRHGGGGERTTVVCGGIRLEHPAARHLAQALPPLIVLESAGERADWTDATLGMLADEVRTPRTGSEAVVSRLCDIVVLQAIRRWIESDERARTGWLGALRDERVGAAIAAIHRTPDHQWSVAELASEVAMSRSAFAARFTELVGESAMRYVTRWRMHVALDRLQTSDDSILTVAQAVGYDSEAAFSRAFKRATGTPPSAVRHRASDDWTAAPAV